MSSRTVARSLAIAGLTALLAVTASPAAGAMTFSPPESTGSLVDRIPLPNGFQPEGIAIDRQGTAYVGSLADGDIYAADVRSGEGEVIIQGPGTPSFINDVVLTKDAAWFTDSMQAQLYKVPLGPGGALPDAGEIEPVALTGEWVQEPGFNANGIAQTPDKQALLVIQTVTGILYRVDPATGEATVVDLGGELLPNGDGLLVVGRTLYVVQNQLNSVAVVELDPSGASGEVVDQLTSPEFQVPTTVAAYANSLFLPNARFGTTPTPDTTYQVTRIDR
jgi:sugar lactone lactonase YvrE